MRVSVVIAILLGGCAVEGDTVDLAFQLDDVPFLDDGPDRIDCSCTIVYDVARFEGEWSYTWRMPDSEPSEPIAMRWTLDDDFLRATNDAGVLVAVFSSLGRFTTHTPPAGSTGCCAPLAEKDALPPDSDVLVTRIDWSQQLVSPPGLPSVVLGAEPIAFHLPSDGILDDAWLPVVEPEHIRVVTLYRGCAGMVTGCEAGEHAIEHVFERH